MELAMYVICNAAAPKGQKTRQRDMCSNRSFEQQVQFYFTYGAHGRPELQVLTRHANDHTKGPRG